ncbi:MAG: glycosyltransferase [Prevotella sp.]|nr:glycosyltransferase [Prevotella sp.]
MTIMQVITRSELGGAQSVMANIANALCQYHHVIVIAGEGDGKLWDILDPKITKISCPFLQRKPSLLRDPQAIWFLRKQYRIYKPDVIHLHSSKAGLLGRIAFPSSKIVYTVHGFDSIRLKYRSFIPVERFSQYLCHFIVGVSQYDEKNLKAEGIRRNVSYIYNGIPEPKADAHTPLSCQGYEKKVLCIARISQPKRFDLFLDVARRLPQYAFVWIGNLEEVKDIPNNVFMMGNLVNAQAHCADADLFFLPSNYEGLPMVIIEAMSHGKPIVASEVGGISEIVRNGVNGYTVENDPAEMAEIIQKMIEDPQLCKQMGRQSRKIFEDKLTSERMIARYMDLYQKIAGKM